MFHIPAHKNLTHPAGQYIDRPTERAEENASEVPTAPREPKPRACGGTTHGTCFGSVLQQRIIDRS